MRHFESRPMFRNIREARDAIAELESAASTLTDGEYESNAWAIMRNIRMHRPARNISAEVLENWREAALADSQREMRAVYDYTRDEIQRRLEQFRG